MFVSKQNGMLHDPFPFMHQFLFIYGGSSWNIEVIKTFVVKYFIVPSLYLIFW